MATYTLEQPTLWKRITDTDDSLLLMILRLTVALVIFPHGAQKLLGWFGGIGFEGTMAWFTQDMDIPYFFALLAVVTEFFGSLALAAGFLTRIAAFAISFTMLVAMLRVHVMNGFFMNWSGFQAGEGFEFHLLVIGICVVLIMAGGGRYSVDGQLEK